MNEWELTFEDNFEGNKLDSDKWMAGYYWGQNLLNDDYVQVNENQFFKLENLEVSNGNLKITTKQEKTQGKLSQIIFRSSLHLVFWTENH